MGIIPNRGMFGLPGLPFQDNISYESSDVFVDLTFLDHTGTPVQPTSFTWELDDISNATCMIGSTIVESPVLNSDMQYTLQLPANEMQMTHQWQGSQLCQLSMSFSATDSVTGTVFNGRGVVIIELVSIQTPFNGS